jgi:hypothetical protein
MSYPQSSNILQWLSGAADPIHNGQQCPITPKKPLPEPTSPTTPQKIVFSSGYATTETTATQWSSSEDVTSDCENNDPFQDLSSEKADNSPFRPYELARFTDVTTIIQLRCREVLAVPCLQCVLLDLPCDSAYGGCSRCNRRDQQRLCLAQRPVLQEEPEFKSHGLIPSGYKLLRLEEDDELWEEKKQLEAEVRETALFLMPCYH